MPKAPKRHLCALNFVPIQYYVYQMSYFHKVVKFSKAILLYCQKYLPLLQQIADSLKKISLVGTLVIYTLLKLIKRSQLYSIECASIAENKMAKATKKPKIIGEAAAISGFGSGITKKMQKLQAAGYQATSRS